MKKSEINRKDKETSSRIRGRGKCERCGNTETLQTAHIISRKYLKLRFDNDNLFCFCAKCHRWAHDHPTFFGIYVEKCFKGKHSVLNEKYFKLYGERLK